MDIETSNAIKLFFRTPSLVQVFFEADRQCAGCRGVRYCDYDQDSFVHFA